LGSSFDPHESDTVHLRPASEKRMTRSNSCSISRRSLPAAHQPPRRGGAMAITRLGHVGLHVRDMDRSIAFFRDILGLQVTDSAPGKITILSSQPRLAEHHELVLVPGRTNGRVVQQISFHCAALQDLRDYHQRLRAAAAPINMIVSHGNAIGLYFQDPDGNQIEVYYATGIDWPQPRVIPVDLNASDADILSAHLRPTAPPAS
jgi:catechol-2,3-dioxygenase